MVGFLKLGNRVSKIGKLGFENRENWVLKIEKSDFRNLTHLGPDKLASLPPGHYLVEV